MEVVQTQTHLHPDLKLMNPIRCKLRATLSLNSSRFRANFCVLCPNLTSSSSSEEVNGRRVVVKANNGKVSSSSSTALLKEKWLDSLTYPHEDNQTHLQAQPTNPWVIGIDPDLSGALALLKSHDSGCIPQVFDAPHLKVLVGKRIRRRLDAKSIVQLLQSFDAPIGTTAYIEQSIPFPQDGKQGWWSGGFGYGLWIGILVASGFSVVPIPSFVWKNGFKLSGNNSSKDDSREVASTLFPSMSSLLRRKKDHGRAEALLIAAYGKGLKLTSDSSCESEVLIP